MRKMLCFVCAVLCASIVCFQSIRAQGSLEAVGKNQKALGACPLKHTDVKAEVSGFLSRVRVRQEFENNFAEPIEAVYIFPLPDAAAVDEMTMNIGSRTVRGKILKREDARKVYETAKNNGQSAALLDQERPNVFTQAVANIAPNEKITIEISYVETLKYTAGAYKFVFPTVVAPRYNPVSVTDAKQITPKLAPKDVRAGHDISIEVNVDAGVPIENVASNTHEIETTMLSSNRAVVKLKDQNEIPNRDFVLSYDVSGKRIEDALITHKDERGGYFTLILQPPDKTANEDITPKEIVFVLDTSGSMSGFPIEKAKEAMKMALDGLHPLDTFNLITFAGDTAVLFDKPVPATRENMRKAQAFLESRHGGGGTEMMTAIKAALEPSDAADHVRVVCFMTDGFVGNEAEIIAEVQKHPNARVFSFGIGSSVNRYLLQKIADEGRGEAEFVNLQDDGSSAAKRFHERVRTPLLTDISIDWNGLPVADVYPQRIGDLFDAKPVIINGRYTAAANGTIKLKGKIGGQAWEREIKINLPDSEPAHDVLATLWARQRVEDLTAQDYTNQKPETAATITNLALEYRLLTQFTSFVAVEEKTVIQNGQPRRVEVPVETPQGVNRDMIVGEGNYLRREFLPNKNSTRANKGGGGTIAKRRIARGSGTGSGNGSGTSPNYGMLAGSILQPPLNSPPSPKPTPLVLKRRAPSTVSGGVLNGKAVRLVQPPLPQHIVVPKAGSTVNVQVTIDESGNVIAASAVSGHPLLRAAAVQAARSSTFTPTTLSGQPVKVTGVISYNFAPDGSSPNIVYNEQSTTVAPESNVPPQSTEAQLRQAKLDAKLHERIAVLLDKLRVGQTKFDEFAFVRDGKADVFVQVETMTASALAELKANGLEIVTTNNQAKFVAGRLALDKIAALALLDNVRLVAPQN